MTGYIYCFSNPEKNYNNKPIYKIGFTLRDPRERCRELFNSSVTFEFKIEFAKQVENAQKIERKIHIVFDEYRLNKSREYFIAPLDKIKKLFDIFDGTWWNDDDNSDDDDDDEKIINMLNENVNTNVNINENVNDNEDNTKTSKSKKKDRNMRLYFKDGQQIRHIQDNHEWIGIYNYDENCILHNEIKYYSPSGFAETHKSLIRPDISKNTSGWRWCQCNIDGEWIRLDLL